jgi:hypothetical protein
MTNVSALNDFVTEYSGTAFRRHHRKNEFGDHRASHYFNGAL